jgi:hypothetical protein
MKKVLFFALVALFSVSCASSSRLVSTSRELAFKGMKPVTVTDVVADLDISPTKITHFYIPSKVVNNAGSANVIKTAIREALISNGNADVLVGLDTQIKYNGDNEIESITVTGYPAKYVNFRSVDAKYILEMAKLYMDLNLKIGYDPGSDPVPNIIPDIRPDINPGQDAQKDFLPTFGKIKRNKR